jgi:cyclopropane-fatty-acyl-phospholipid synthase
MTIAMPKPADPAVAITLSLLSEIIGSSAPPDVAVRLWDGTLWKPEQGTPARCTLVLRHPGALRSMFLPPSDVRVAEAYMFDDFDIEGEIEGILPLFESLLERRFSKLDLIRYGTRLITLPAHGRSRPGNVAAKVRGRLHSIGRDRQAVGYHYDISNEFFALWLGSRMVYTCAYFASPDDDLDTAQEQKLDYVCHKLRLRPGERLLDLGCGWGGLAIYAAERYGVEVQGITLSAQQAELGQARIRKAGLEERCRIDYSDFRELPRPQAYDKVAAVGCIEHLGEALLPRFFRCAWESLRPGGVFLNHAIGIHANTPPLGKAFVHRYLFPDSELVSIGTVLRVAEAVGFDVRDVENLKEHYTHTLRHWLRRLEKHAGEAKRLVGEPTYRRFRLFLVVALREMESGPGKLYQTLLVKPRNGRSGLPLRREDWYA